MIQGVGFGISGLGLRMYRVRGLGCQGSFGFQAESRTPFCVPFLTLKIRGKNKSQVQSKWDDDDGDVYISLMVSSS